MHPFTWIGLALIMLGVAFVILPIIGKYIDVSNIPPWLIYIYRSDGFYFVTSPLLLLISLISILLYFFLK
ncbi:MAG: hypothetical protein QXT22_00710 [Candidatus Hadarchaeales archaeon]